MFKARKSRINFSQRSSQTNNENASQNAQRFQVGQRKSIFSDDEDDLESIIPPSQGPSQTLQEKRMHRSQLRRFLTQRSNNRFSTLSQQTNSSQIVKTYFESLLLKAGCCIDEESYVLDCDIFAFQNRLDDNLRIADSYPANIELLLTDIKTILARSDEEWCKLMTCVQFILYSGDSDSIHSQRRETSNSSLLRILLLNTDLQRGVLEILFRELKKRAKAQNDIDIQQFDLLVGQMQYLSYNKENMVYIFGQFFEVLAECDLQTRDELIKVADDLIDPTRHSEAINMIITMVPTIDQLFTSKNLATFESLCLNTATMKKLRVKVINYINDGAPKTSYVNLLNFMTRFNHDEKDHFYEILNDVRDCIDWQLQDPDVQENLYDFVKRSISRCQVTRDSWLKIIKMTDNARDHKIVDIFALLAISMKNDDKIQKIENLIKKKIKSRVFTVEYFQETIKFLSGVLTDYVHVLTDILEVCFKDKDPYTQFFASIGFRIIFKIRNGDRHYIVSRLVALICTKPLNLPFAKDDVRSNALTVLSEIKKRLDNESKGAFYKVDRILDYSYNLTLDQFRLVTKILCSLAFDAGGEDCMQTEINIRARKDVTDIYLMTKMQGIISICQILNHTIWMLKREDSSSTCSDNTIDTISQIYSGPGHEAADLLKFALNSSHPYVDALMLYYDELALLFSPRNRDLGYIVEDNAFLKWVSQTLEKSVSEIFVVDKCPEARGTKLEYFYNINTPTSDSEAHSVKEEALQLAINIGGLALTHNERELPEKAIHVLCPLLNALYNVLYRRCGTNLEYINALLGCAVVLPSTFANEDHILAEHERLGLDMYFFTANWFRSVISAFSSQQSPILRRKVLIRMSQLINIEASIKYMLMKSPSTYEPPPCSYRCMEVNNFKAPRGTKITSNFERNNDINAIRRGKKRKHAETKGTNTEQVTQFDEEQMNINTTTGNLPVVTQFNISQGTQSVEIVKNRSMLWCSYGEKEKYRQMDIDIMFLLEEPLEIKYPVPPQDIGKCLHLPELKFILFDIISKIESLTGVKKFRVDQQLQVLISPISFINDLVISLKLIIQFLKQLATYLQNIIEEAKENEELLYCSEVNQVKICTGTCFHLLAALFSWPGFSVDDHFTVLYKALNTLLEREYDSSEMIEQPSQSDLQNLADEALSKIVEYEHVILDLRSAVHLLHLAKALARISDNNELIAKLSKNLLTKKWYTVEGNEEQGKNTNLLLVELLKCFMKEMELNEIEQMVETLGNEMINLKTKDMYMQTFPNFNKSNCSLVYRSLLNACDDAMKRSANGTMSSQSLVDIWKQCFDILRTMLAINEKNPIVNNSTSFLKYAHSMVDLFRRNGVKAISKMLTRNAEDVHSLLTSMQKTTRFLHNLSCHTKNCANSKIIRQIPLLRSTMEKLVHEIKSVLAGNHALSSFWLGNLKNKDIHGVELLSQVTPVTEDDDIDSPSNSSDEEPEEDLREASNLTASSSSASKIFG